MAKNYKIPTRSEIAKLKEVYQSSKNPLAYIPYADALRRSGALNLALEVCREGLQNDSYSVTGRTLLGKILYDMGRYDEALEELGYVLQYARDAFGANLLMARIMVKKMEFNEALDIVKNLKMLNPKEPDVLALEDFIHTQMFSMETEGDFAMESKKKSKDVLERRINDLMRKLREHSDIEKFSLSNLPEDDPAKEKDPVRELFLSSKKILSEKFDNQLEDIVAEMDRNGIILYFIEGSLLTVIARENADIARIRFQIKNILMS